MSHKHKIMIGIVEMCDCTHEIIHLTHHWKLCKPENLPYIHWIVNEYDLVALSAWAIVNMGNLDKNSPENILKNNGTYNKLAIDTNMSHRNLCSDFAPLIHGCGIEKKCSQSTYQPTSAIVIITTQKGF